MMNPIPRMRFFGNEFARDMGAVFAENLADLLAKVDDGTADYPKGFVHTSTLPHEGTCYYDQVWARDAGRGAQELARFGFVEQAQAAVEYFLSHKNFGDHWGRLIDRSVPEDFELDGNTHILNGIAETWRASGRDKELGARYMNACREVFDWMESCMDSCPVGDLIPCQSELAGNPCGDGVVYAIYPNYGAVIAMRNFADLAQDCELFEDAERLHGLAFRLMDGILSALVSRGEEERTRTPAGVWLNGLTAQGECYEEANFGARFAIHHWTRQAPFIQNFDAGLNTLEEDDAKKTHIASYEYLRHEMAKGIYFRKYGFVSNTCWTGAGGRHDDTMCGYGQNYFTQAALMMDDVNTYGKCLEGIARLAYDGDIIEPMTFEMNPYILHECFEYDHYEQALDHTFGKRADWERMVADNPGDEGNLVQACETLKTLAMTAGVSVEDGVLIVKPRLPWRWDGMELKDFPVTDRQGRVYRISLTYRHERWERSCSLKVTQSGGLERVRVRFGPFPAVTSSNTDWKQYEREAVPGASFFWSEGGLEQSIAL